MGSKRTGKKQKGKKCDRKKKRQWDEEELPDSNEEFAFIAGYTSWGFPYGIRWDEVQDEEKQEEMISYEELPFD